MPLPAVLGLVALLPVALIYLAAGLVIPMPALWLVQAAGASLALYGWSQRRTRPTVTAVMPVVLVVLLIAVTTAGDIWLGWTA